MKLYNNDYARAVYLLDKLDRAHSFTGVIQDIGFVGAALLWDIEDIQQGFVEKIEFLDLDGNSIVDLNADTQPVGIRISYQTNDKLKRKHEQYSCKFDSLPDIIKVRLSNRDSDVLYLRGTENLVTGEKSFNEYKCYIESVRAGGHIVSDSRIEHLTWRLEDQFGERTTIALDDDEQFGYAGKKAKITTDDPEAAFQGHVNILQKK